MLVAATSYTRSNYAFLKNKLCDSNLIYKAVPRLHIIYGININFHQGWKKIASKLNHNLNLFDHSQFFYIAKEKRFLFLIYHAWWKWYIYSIICKAIYLVVLRSWEILFEKLDKPFIWIQFPFSNILRFSTELKQFCSFNFLLIMKTNSIRLF